MGGFGEKERREKCCNYKNKNLSKSKVTIKSVLVRTWTGKIMVNLEKKKKQKWRWGGSKPSPRAHPESLSSLKVLVSNSPPDSLEYHSNYQCEWGMHSDKSSVTGDSHIGTLQRVSARKEHVSHLHSGEQNDVTRTGDQVDCRLARGRGRRGVVGSEGVAAGTPCTNAHNTGPLSTLWHRNFEKVPLCSRASENWFAPLKL